MCAKQVPRSCGGEHGSGHPLVSEEFLVLPGDKDIDSYLDGNSDEPGVFRDMAGPWSMRNASRMP